MKRKSFFILLLLIIPTVAFARIGTGIGISFPIGGDGETTQRSENVPTYAAFTDGVLMQELTVEEKNGKVIERWSTDIDFTQAIQNEVYPAKETVTHRGSFDIKTTKTINGTPAYISAQIMDTDNIVIAKLPSKIKVTTTRREGIRGSIVITSEQGRW